MTGVLSPVYILRRRCGELLTKTHQRLLEDFAVVLVAPAEHCLGVPDLKKEALASLRGAVLRAGRVIVVIADLVTSLIINLAAARVLVDSSGVCDKSGAARVALIVAVRLVATLVLLAEVGVLVGGGAGIPDLGAVDENLVEDDRRRHLDCFWG
jgi:hypothetical protein